jgi:hypothetical protein
MQTSDLEAIKARLAAASPGPWHHGSVDDRLHAVFDANADGEICTLYDVDGEGFPADAFQGDAANAELIAHAPTDLAALVAEVERLRGENERQADRLRRVAGLLPVSLSTALGEDDGEDEDGNPR